MEDDTWSFALSTSSRSYQSALKSLSDLCIDFEEIEGDDDDEIRAEYPCPYCTEDFDLVDLCSHIEDEHPFEDKPEVCPVCASRVCMNLVSHITTSHGDMLKSLQKLNLQKDNSCSTLSLLKKELEDDYFQSLVSGSSATVSSLKMAPDPLLSFLYNAPPVDKSSSVPSSSIEANLEEESADDKALESPLMEINQDSYGEELEDNAYKEMFRCLPCLIKNTWRRQRRVSLHRDCYCPPCSMMTYERQNISWLAVDFRFIY